MPLIKICWAHGKQGSWINRNKTNCKLLEENSFLENAFCIENLPGVRDWVLALLPLHSLLFSRKVLSPFFSFFRVFFPFSLSLACFWQWSILVWLESGDLLSLYRNLLIITKCERNPTFCIFFSICVNLLKGMKFGCQHQAAITCLRWLKHGKVLSSLRWVVMSLYSRSHLLILMKILLSMCVPEVPHVAGTCLSDARNVLCALRASHFQLWASISSFLFFSPCLLDVNYFMMCCVWRLFNSFGVLFIPLIKNPNQQNEQLVPFLICITRRSLGKMWKKLYKCSKLASFFKIFLLAVA